MRWGDYILIFSMTINGSMALAYAYQGFYAQSCYWLSALGINLSLFWMR